LAGRNLDISPRNIFTRRHFHPSSDSDYLNVKKLANNINLALLRLRLASFMTYKKS